MGDIKWFVIIMLVFFGFLTLGAFMDSKEPSQRMNNCIDVVNRAIPDANDTQARSSLLEKCFENK